MEKKMRDGRSIARIVKEDRLGEQAKAIVNIQNGETQNIFRKWE